MKLKDILHKIVEAKETTISIGITKGDIKTAIDVSINDGDIENYEDLDGVADELDITPTKLKELIQDLIAEKGNSKNLTIKI